MGIAIVTGANRGIGLELCRGLQARGRAVVAACRNSSAELEALGVRVHSGLDVTRDEAVAVLASAVAGETVDLLVNNAGVFLESELESLDFDVIRHQLEVNALGPLRVTAALLPRMKHGAKVAIITSRMGSIADNTSGGSYGYRMSKAALNAAGVSLAHDLEARGIAVVTLHPGYVRTRMTGHQGNVAPAESARDLLDRLDELTLETTGRFRHANGQDLPW